MPPPRDQTLPSVKRIFVDRDEPKRLFERSAFQIPENGAKLLVFYGPGGEGKTALLRELLHNINPAVEPSYSFLKTSELDLHDRPKDDPESVLVRIRNGFAEAGLSLPAFDLAFALIWDATRSEQPLPNLKAPWLRRTAVIANEGTEKIASLADNWVQGPEAAALVGEIASEIPGIGLLFRTLGRWAFDKSKSQYLHRTRGALKELYRNGQLKKPYELTELLPWMLAQDLNHYLGEHPKERFLLFVDEYERVFDDACGGARWRDSSVDRCLRRLIQHTNGLLAVFFSRERLPWELDSDWRDDLNGAQHLLSGLAEKDAEAFLIAIPIEQEQIRRAIIEGSRESSNSDALVYPLMLDLQVEHWRALRAKGQVPSPEHFALASPTFEGRRREIVSRMLRDYSEHMQHTIARLSVTSFFDRDAFAFVIDTFKTGLPLDDFERITALSFITHTDNGFFRMHNVVAEVIRETLGQEVRSTSVDGLQSYYAAKATVTSPREVTDTSVAFLFEAASLYRASGRSGYVDWLARISEPLFDAGRFGACTQLWRDACDHVEHTLGPEHPDLASALHNLFVALRQQGMLSQARPVCERTLEIRKKAFGLTHPLTANALSAIAIIDGAEGRYDEAEQKLRAVLSIRRDKLGAEHPHTLSAWGDLGEVFLQRGAYDHACQAYGHVFACYSRSQPESLHSQIAVHLNYGTALRRRGEFDSARPLLERALAMSESYYSEGHLEVGKAKHALAGMKLDDGEFDDACSLFRGALHTFERLRGPEDPLAVTARHNLAVSLQRLGKLGEARALFERLLASALKPPANNLDIAMAHAHLGGVLLELGDLQTARQEYEVALEFGDRFGALPDHYLTILSGLASVYHRQGLVNEARSLHERHLTLSEQCLGYDHPSTATAAGNFGHFLYSVGEREAGKHMLVRAQSIRSARFGPNHPFTVAIAAAIQRWERL